MNIRLLLLIAIYFSLYSCKAQSSKISEEDILGEWIFAKEISLNDKVIEIEEELAPPSPEMSSLYPLMIGYEFFPDNICENKAGYFLFKENNGKRIFHFLGTMTKYRIENDSLKIFNPAHNIWNAIKIYSIIDDTLTLQFHFNNITKFAKASYILDDNNDFDTLIVSSSGCYGTCPISNTLISNEGNVVYYGKDFNTINGFFTSNITEAQINKIKIDLKKSNFMQLKDEYIADWTDDEEISLTIVKNGKIIKTIMDYGHRSPNELYFLMNQIRFLYQNLQLDTLKNFPLEFKGDIIYFEHGNKIIKLVESEGFYLWNLLSKAKETQKSFKKKYHLYFNTYSQKIKIETDGQFYKFKKQDGSIKILDLGYNFLDRNNLKSKLRVKNDYE